MNLRTEITTNGTTVSDWLGTAGVNASLAVTKIAEIRSGDSEDLADAMELLQEALDELNTVRVYTQP